MNASIVNVPSGCPQNAGKYMPAFKDNPFISIKSSVTGSYKFCKDFYINSDNHRYGIVGIFSKSSDIYIDNNLFASNLSCGSTYNSIVPGVPKGVYTKYNFKLSRGKHTICVVAKNIVPSEYAFSLMLADISTEAIIVKTNSSWSVVKINETQNTQQSNKNIVNTQPTTRSLNVNTETINKNISTSQTMPYNYYTNISTSHPTEASMVTDMKNILSKYGVYIALGLGLMLLLGRRE